MLSDGEQQQWDDLVRRLSDVFLSSAIDLDERDLDIERYAATPSGHDDLQQVWISIDLMGCLLGVAWIVIASVESWSVPLAVAPGAVLALDALCSATRHLMWSGRLPDWTARSDRAAAPPSCCNRRLHRDRTSRRHRSRWGAR
jgi:hypothetical protein